MSANINSAQFVSHSLAILVGLSAGLLAYSFVNRSSASANDQEYTIADQPLRFARGKASNNTRMMNIDAIYNPTYARGLTVLVTGMVFAFFGKRNALANKY